MKKVLKWTGITFGVLIVLGVIGSMAGGSNSSSETSSNSENKSVAGVKETQPAKEVKPKPGDVISGIGRKELEDNYNEQKKLSKLKADQYAASLVSEKVVWIAQVENVDTDITGEVYISSKMGIYSVYINDPQQNWAKDLVKGDVVKVTGSIQKLYDLIGVTVYVDPISVEKL